MVSSGHINQHKKIMNFSVKKQYISVRVICIKSCSPLHFQLPLKVLLNLKKNIEHYQVPKGKSQGIEPYGNLNISAYQNLSCISFSQKHWADCTQISYRLYIRFNFIDITFVLGQLTKMATTPMYVKTKYVLIISLD